MSKPTTKQAMPGPYDPPAKPAQSRKVSQQGPASKNANNSSKNKFYDGPTVSAKADEVKVKAQDVARTAVAQTKKKSKKAVATARRHPWSILSIITTIPFLITMSLFSTVVCPPPTQTMSPISKFVLSPLGLHDASSQHSELHKAFCYPANLYHRDVLEPYVYPIVEDLQSRAQAHPIYVKALEPGYRVASVNGKRIWEGPVKPVVEKTRKGVRRAYLTFVEPHLPYLKTKTQTFTAPYTSRISALHQQYVAPHLNTAGQYARTAGKSGIDTYNYVAGHPITGHAGRYANKGYQISRTKGQQAYEWSRPHAIRGGKEAERIAREILGPRVIAGAQYAGEQIHRIWVLIKIHVQRLYYAHLDPHVGPYVSKAHTTLSPYATLFHTKVYRPYIFPVLESILPPAVLAPTPPKSFWALIADILPGSHVAERKADMKQFHKNVDKADKPAQVPVPGAAKVAKAESAQKDTKEARKFDREEMVRVREAIRERVEKQGKNGYDALRSELIELHTSIVADSFQAFKKSAKTEMEREFDYVSKGLDRLYTGSTKLTRDQVQKSGAQADARVAKKLEGIKERSDRLKKTWFDQGKPVVRRHFDDLNAALGTEHGDLAQKMAWMDDVTPKDWTNYNALKESVEAWSKKYVALHEGDTKDRALAAPAANPSKTLSSFNTELDDMMEGWRDQVRLQRKTAYDRIEAREVLGTESPKATPVKVNTASKSASDSRVSILPIVEAGAAAAAAGGIIGKGKDQVLDALSQASAAVAGETTAAGVVDQAKAAVESVYEQASEGVHQATRSAMSAVGATPSPESLGEHVESVWGGAAGQAQAVYVAAGSVVHDATRSAMSAVGATPSPESLNEHVGSVVGVAGEKASAAYDAASSIAHDATRSAMSAVGATPSPEGAAEHLESLANVVKAGYASVADNIGDTIHDATRAGLSAVGVTPSPESLADHIESVASEVSASVSSVASAASASASSLADAAGSVIHDGTRAAHRAVGVEPTPESILGHAESLLSVASASIESAASVASEAVHSAARSAVVAAGGTPSPETPQEYAASIAAVAGDAAVSVYEQATASAASVYQAASSGAVGAAGAAAGVAAAGSAVVVDQAGAIGQQIQEALGMVSTQEPLASTASAYLASLSAAIAGPTTAAGVGASLQDMIASGQSVLADLRSQAGQKVHEATRAASRAAGVRPTPESAGEYLEEVKERVKQVQEEIGGVVGDARDLAMEQAERVSEGVKRAVGRDEL